MLRQDVARFYIIALKHGLLSRLVPIAWADEQIARGDIPDIALIDLALTANQPVDQVMDALKPLAGPITPNVVRLAVGLLADRLKRREYTEAEVANLLYRLHREDDCFEAVLGPALSWIDEAFEPDMMGPEEGAAHVRRFLAPFENHEFLHLLA
jgi:hypothetical protein